MNRNKDKIHFRIASIISLSLILIISLIFACASFALNQINNNAPSDSLSENSNLESTGVSAISSEASEIADTVTEIINEETSVDSEVSLPEIQEPKHCFIQNKYGYTFIYGDSGFEQFNYGSTTLNTYINSLIAFSEHFSKETPIYNITVPVSTTFVDIPSDIKNEHDFHNKSQSTFVELVGEGIKDNITNLSIVDEIQERYNNGEYLFYRTDRNWTPSASYTAYSSFCEAAGLNQYAISIFPEKVHGDYLGWFHFATQDKDMASNPDKLIYYSPIPSVKTVLTVYDGGMKLNNYKLCQNSVDIEDAYDIFVGTTAGRYEIVSTTMGGNLLIVGDSSVFPMLPFLVSHYGKIDVINPVYFNTPLSEYLENRHYDQVITMCYTTNATAGDFMPSFSKFIEENNNE